MDEKRKEEIIPEMTPAMLSAGARAVAECLDDPCLSYCELVAKVAFEAMRRAANATD